MSGHSKWHNIQKTKGAADAKRSAAFTKIAKEIIVAVKEGGGSGDPNNNSRLATVIAKAKAVNMPNDNIKRTIDRALGSGSYRQLRGRHLRGLRPRRRGRHCGGPDRQPPAHRAGGPPRVRQVQRQPGRPGLRQLVALTRRASSSLTTRRASWTRTPS